MIARAPASSANLGPGFDVLALALSCHVVVEVVPATRLSVTSSGEGAELAAGAEHLAARVATDVAGTDHLAIRVDSEIPVSRGLGSSAALATATAAAAGAKDPLAVAAAVDGHPENAAASCAGGLVAAVPLGTGILPVSLPLDPDLAVVAVVPGTGLATAEARGVLGATVERRAASANLARMALLLTGLADLDRLRPEATGDCLHQEARTALVPRAPGLLQALLDAGALAACWSGAGPTMIGFCRVARAAGIRDRVLAVASPGDRVLVLRPDTGGLVTGADAEGVAVGEDGGT